MIKTPVFPLHQKQIYYCSHARAALFYGLLALGLKRDDEVLIPDYICNVVLAPFHEAGLRTVYYRLKPDLTPDWDHVKGCLSQKTKAFLIVNYFGFPNALEDAQKLCSGQGLFFIEDNAHGFLSYCGDRPLGSFGDISIFAFHKTIHMPTGAALVINRPPDLNPGQMVLGKALDTRMFVVKNVLLQLKKLLKCPLNSEKLVRQIYPTAHDKAQEYDLRTYALEMPKISKDILSRVQAERVRQLRRSKYRYWLKYFQEKSDPAVKVMFPSLDEGVCPQVFPVYVNDRQQFIKAMAHKGIASFIWPYLPHDSKENDLSQHIVCLPLE